MIVFEWQTVWIFNLNLFFFGLIFKSFFPKRINFWLFIEETSHENNLSEAGENKDGHVEHWHEVDPLEVVLGYAAVLEIRQPDLVLQVPGLHDIFFDFFQFYLKRKNQCLDFLIIQQTLIAAQFTFLSTRHCVKLWDLKYLFAQCHVTQICLHFVYKCFVLCSLQLALPSIVYWL